MTPENPKLESLLESLNLGGEAVSVAYAHNYLFEERVSLERQRRYEKGFAPAKTELKAWKNSHKKYCSLKIKVSGGDVPETFLEMNRDALLSVWDENQFVVRMERLDGIFSALSALDYNLPQMAEQWEIWKETKDKPSEKEKGEDAKAFLDNFCNQWNGLRDNRPLFAGFYDELKEDIESDAWPKRIRNRLGLSHYNPGLKKTIPVALMRYPAGCILKGPGRPEKDRAFSVPTVLDGELNTHFFPSPRSEGYGRTLDLEPDPNGERLVSEILHRRMDYSPDHFHKFGEITTPIPKRDRGNALAELRNQHLFLLRVESEKEDFGADIPIKENA